MSDISQLTKAELGTLEHVFLLTHCILTVTLFSAAGNAKGTAHRIKSWASFAWTSPTSWSSQLHVPHAPLVVSTIKLDPSYTSITAS